MRRRVSLVLLWTLCAACGSHDAGSNENSQHATVFVNTAPTLDNEALIDGKAERVTLSADGQIWLGTGRGQIIVGDSIYSHWRDVLYPSFRKDWSRAMMGMFASVSVVAAFTPDTVIAMGLGGDLHRTVDGGENWDTISFGEASFISAAFSTASGRGWIGGGGPDSSPAFFATDDYGATWRTVVSPFDSRISSIFMESAKVGLVGGLWNRLAQTTDGGVSWEGIPTPFDEGVVPDAGSDGQHVLEAVAIVGDRIIVKQGEWVFQSRRGTINWSPVSGDIRHFAYDREQGRLYGLNASGQVLQYDEDFNPTKFGQGSSQGFAIHMEARAGKVVVLEREGALFEVTATRSQYGFPLSNDTDWRMSKVRRSDDRLWGVSTHQIYTSMDMGLTWDRVGFMPSAIRSFITRSHGDLLLWDGHGRNMIYDPEEGTLRPLESLHGYDVVDILQLGTRWVAFGGRQYETMGRVEVGRTYFAGQFEGSRANGFVLVSEDEGETWRKIDDWENGGVANVFVNPISGDMTLVSYLGGVRRLTRTGSAFSATDLVLPSPEAWQSVPYVEVPSVVYFESDTRGFIDGWIHHIGERRYTTSDSGRTWSEVRPAIHEIRAVPVPSGYVVMRGSEMTGGTELVLRSGSREIPIWRAEVQDRGPGQSPWDGITDFSIDDRGQLIVLVDGVTLIVLDIPAVRQ